MGSVMSHRSHVQKWRVGTGPGILCCLEGEAVKMFLSQGNKFISKCKTAIYFVEIAFPNKEEKGN